MKKEYREQDGDKTEKLCWGTELPIDEVSWSE